MAEPGAVTATARLGGATHAWIRVDDPGTGPDEAWDHLVDQLAGLGAGPDDVAQLQIFAADPAVLDHFSGIRAPAHRLCQAPCSGATVALLAWAVFAAPAPDAPVDSAGARAGGLGVQVVEPGLARIRLAGGQLAVFGTSDIRPGGDPQAAWSGCFAAAEARLARLGLDYAAVAKTWTYYGDRAGGSFPAFGRARECFFAGRRFALRGGYPTSTGMGTGDRAISLAGIALGPGTGATALANPRQADPATYGALFSRAAEVDLGGADRLILLGGTASVQDGQVIYPARVDRQVGYAADLVTALLDAAGPGHRLGSLVGYVKHAGDAPTVDAVLAARYPGVPRVLVQADLSRDTLLVELDAMAYRSDRGE